MFSKLLLIILVMGAAAVALLVLRQRRIETVHRTAQLHQELVEQRQALWESRRRIAEACAPARVRETVDATSDVEWTAITSGDS